MNYYIITFDRKNELSYKSFHEEFVAHPKINKWFHYIKSSYIIGSTTITPDEITDHFIEIAEKYKLPKTHLVLNVNLLDRQGRLTNDAWKWLKNNSIS